MRNKGPEKYQEVKLGRGVCVRAHMAHGLDVAYLHHTDEPHGFFGRNGSLDETNLIIQDTMILVRHALISWGCNRSFMDHIINSHLARKDIIPAFVFAVTHIQHHIRLHKQLAHTKHLTVGTKYR